MGQKNFNLDKWTLIEEGSALTYTRTKPRNVAIDVNCPGDTHFYVVVDVVEIDNDPKKLEEVAAGRDRMDSEATGQRSFFLGLAKGRDRFEFAVPGAFRLYVENGPAYVTSSDGEFVHTEIPPEDRPIFTKVARRRERNPHLEMIEYTMRQNQNAFMAQIEAEMERRERTLEERYAERQPPKPLAAKLAGARPADPEEDGADGTGATAGTGEADQGETGDGGKSPKRRKPSPAPD